MCSDVPRRGRLAHFVTGFLLSCWVAIPAARADQPTDAQRLAMLAKPSVVRVYGAWFGEYSFNDRTWSTAIGGTGSGFFLSADGYIATNAHVTEVIHDGEDKAKEKLYQQVLKQILDTYGAQLLKLSDAAQRAQVQSIRLTSLKKLAFVVLPNGDKLQYDIKAYGAPVGEGKDCSIIKVVANNAPTLPVGDSTKVQVQDHVTAIGYPGVADLTGLLDEKSQLEASVTDGKISAIKRTQSGDQVLQITAPTSHGNSGGPALNDAGEVIGLVTFSDAREVQGFNFLVSSQTLTEFIRQAGTEAKPSSTNIMWREALELYWDQDYSDAINKLQELLQMYPAHSEAANIIRLSREGQRDGKEKKSSHGGVVAGLIIAGLMLGGVGFMMLRRSKASPGPRPMQQHAPPPQAGQMMGGVVGPPQIAKTMAIGGAVGPGGGQVAPTAFGSLSIGNVTCTRGLLMGQRFALTPTGIIVGRQPGVAHILVNDSRASGKHVWIGLENGRLVAIDQGTTNGTFLNDVKHGRISRVELKDGDIVIVAEPDCLSLTIKLG